MLCRDQVSYRCASLFNSRSWIVQCLFEGYFFLVSSNVIWNHNHLVWKWTRNHLAKLITVALQKITHSSIMVTLSKLLTVAMQKKTHSSIMVTLLKLLYYCCRNNPRSCFCNNQAQGNTNKYYLLVSTDKPMEIQIEEYSIRTTTCE